MKKFPLLGTASLLPLLSLILCIAFASFAFAGVSLPGLGSLGGKASSSASGGHPNMIGFKTPQTIVHPTENFRYTIPAGWAIVVDSGKRSDDVNNIPKHNPAFTNVKVDGKEIGGCALNITITPMVASFPREKAVAAGLKQDKERIAIKEVKEAKRRDQGAPKKKCKFIGWQTYEAEKSDPTMNRGIFYQGYDQDNKMYIFGANCGGEENFQMCKDKLLPIIESIEFCVK